MKQKGTDRSGFRTLCPLLFLLIATGCSTHVPNPMPTDRDPKLVGRWVQTGSEIPMILDFRADGTGEALFEEMESGKGLKFEWGADGAKLGFAKPTTDTGLTYELVSYRLTTDPAGVQMSDLQRFSTSREGRIQRLKSDTGFLTRYSLKRL